jgi:L-threonylcarbamoyladenylate synthase
MVSTSANISGEPYINNLDKILDTFGDIDLAYYDAPLGSNNKPSKIIDLDTKKVIRK